MSKYPSNDDSYRFLFKDADIRGETVTLEHVLTDLLAAHDYGAGVRRLLGEFAAATVVISNNLKFRIGQNEEKKTDQNLIEKKIGRNDPCPCGSGKKYKQ